MTTEKGHLPPAIRDVLAAVLTASGLQGDARDEVEQDLRDHFEDGIAAGHSPTRLLEQFGDPAIAGANIANARAEGRSTRPDRLGALGLNSEHTRRSSMFDRIWLDVKLAFRALRRAPAFTAVVLTTLALGVGANTAVFSVLDAVLLKPLPYADPGQLVHVQETWGTPAQPYEFMRAPSIHEMREWDEVFTDVAAFYSYRETGADLTGGDRPERVVAILVSAGFFETLGARPALGRTFTEDESFGPGEYGSGDPAGLAVLSHGLWNRRFGGDPSIVGQTIELDGRAVEVLGVMPQEFVNPFGSAADVWIPQDMRLGGSNGWGNYFLSGVARLRDGLTIETAQARADARVAQVKEAIPDSGDEWGLLMTPLQSHVVGSTRRTMLWLLAAAVGLVLLSACVNVGNLVFARSLDREREVALRGALGAGRRSLVAHLLTENALLAAGGSVLGLGLGMLGVRALLAVAPDALPGIVEPGLSAGVFGFALAAMAASLMTFGLAPTLRLSGVPPATVLRAGGRGGTESLGLRRLRSSLVVAQVAVALVLMVGAGLLVRSFSALRDVPLGVNAEQVYTFEVHLPASRYPEGTDRHAFHEQLQARVAGLPGVEAVGATSWLPLNGRYHVWGRPLRMEDDAAEQSGWAADVRIVSGDYFKAMGLRLQQGPEPSAIDPAGDNVVWLSKSVADRLFPNEDAIGATIWAANDERQVVGIVDDVAWDSRGSMAPTIYVPHAHYADNRNWALIQTVRTRGDFAALREGIVRELRGLDGDLVVYRPRPFEGFVAVARAQDRFALLLMSAFAVLAMTLAGVGTYGILAGSVAKRSREIGIRMALGADARRVRRSIMQSALVLVAGGVGVGAFLAWTGSRWLTSLLFEVRPGDPLTYGTAVLLLLGLGALASFLPANRATRIDPARTLSDD